MFKEYFLHILFPLHEAYNGLAKMQMFALKRIWWHFQHIFYFTLYFSNILQNNTQNFIQSKIDFEDNKRKNNLLMNYYSLVTLWKNIRLNAFVKECTKTNLIGIFRPIVLNLYLHFKCSCNILLFWHVCMCILYVATYIISSLYFHTHPPSKVFVFI